MKIIEIIKYVYKRIRYSKIFTSIGVYIGGNFIQQLASVILVPVWSIFLTPDDYGITGQVALYVSILSTIMGLGFQGAVSRHYYDYVNDPEGQKNYVSSAVIFQIGFSVVLSIIMSIFGKGIWGVLSKTVPANPYMYLTIWTACLRTWTLTILYLYQAQQKAKKFVSLNLLTFILYSLGMLAFVVLLKQGAFGQVLGTLISAFVTSAILLVIFLKKWFSPKMNWESIRSSLKFGLPLIPHSIFGWVNKAADRVILDKFVSLTEIGYYNFSYNVGSIMSMVVDSVNLGWMPHYYKLMKENKNPDKAIINFFSIYLVAIGFICICGNLFSRELIYILFPERYMPSVVYIAPILIAYFFQGLYKFGSAPLFFFKNTKIIPIISGGSALFNIVLNLWLAPKFGAIASAWVTAGTYICLSILGFYLGQRERFTAYPFTYIFSISSLVLISGIIDQFLLKITIIVVVLKTLFILLYCVFCYSFLKSHDLIISKSNELRTG